MRQNRIIGSNGILWAAALMFSISQVAFGQTTPVPGSGSRGGVLITGQHPFDNVTAGLANRGPGHMVSQGVAATQAAADFARSAITITETLQPSIQAKALVSLIQALFDGLNQTLLTLGNAYLTRLGIPLGNNVVGTVTAPIPTVP
ncbi:MAG: hypothetical protein HY287_07205 [Planctomycetes bacterium]|nr:hypothetical protein [Planctomycetota bacterium]